MGRVLLTHLASVAVMLGVMMATGESPRIFVYGLFINYLYRLLTLYGLARLHAAGGARGRGIAERLTRPPHAAQPSFPVTVGEGAGAVPGGIKSYLFVLAVLGYFTFMLINVKNREIGTPAAVILNELAWGFAAGALWCLLDLLDRRITLRFDQNIPTNLGYNSGETTTLAVTTLTGGVISGLMDSPWPYFIALLVFKTWSDVWYETKFPRSEHPAESA
jgi:hypothetical protein